ncbi:MAG: xanthine dehydrogenase family protein subunit M [Bacteroidia bacterium]
MKPFEYQKVASPDEAFASRKAKSVLLAGGTNVLDLMKKHIQQPDQLVDVNDALSNEIEENKEGLRIGAAVKNTAIAEHDVVKSAYPLLSKAILKGASPQIRNMASAAGNIMQRTRCPYFFDLTQPCNKRENGSGCSALGGNHRMGAIIGYSDACVAVHPSDFCVALAALDARVDYLVPNNQAGEEQEIAFTDFHRLPGENPEQDNILPQNAIITGIRIPANNFQKHSAYLKLRDRDSYAFALISVAAALEMKKGKIREARLASGGVAHKAWRWREAEKYLKNKPATTEHFEKAAELVIQQVKALPDNQFKVPMLKAAIQEALKQCANTK